jgi:hypothetical protein
MRGDTPMHYHHVRHSPNMLKKDTTQTGLKEHWRALEGQHHVQDSPIDIQQAAAHRQRASQSSNSEPTLSIHPVAEPEIMVRGPVQRVLTIK